MIKKPRARIMIALTVLSRSPDGVTEQFFKFVYDIDSDILDTLIKAGFARADVERLKQGFDIVRYHITEAGRHVLRK